MLFIRSFLLKKDNNFLQFTFYSEKKSHSPSERLCCLSLWQMWSCSFRIDMQADRKGNRRSEKWFNRGSPQKHRHHRSRTLINSLWRRENVCNELDLLAESGVWKEHVLPHKPKRNLGDLIYPPESVTDNKTEHLDALLRRYKSKMAGQAQKAGRPSAPCS